MRISDWSFRRVLFRSLELTPETEAGLEALRSGFLQFEEAVRAMQAGQTSKSLTIAAPRDFTAKWLNARLARYSASDGELRFSMMAADEPLDFTEANLDLAVRLLDGPGEHEGVRLGEAVFVTGEEGGGGPAPKQDWQGTPADDGMAIMRSEEH